MINNLKKISFFLPNLTGGGAERSIVELSNYFSNKEYDVDLVLAENKGKYFDEIDKKTRLIILNKHSRLQVIFSLTKYLIKRKPNIIFSGGDLTNLTNILSSIFSLNLKKCIIGQRSIIQDNWALKYPNSNEFYTILIRFFYRFPKLIICNSYASYNELESYRFKSKNLHVIRNYLNINSIKEKSLLINNKHQHLIKTKFVLGVGSLSEVKDFKTLIMAFKILNKIDNKINLLILGEGPKRTELEGLIEKLNLSQNVFLLGFQNNPFPFFANCLCYVSTSIAEGCPNTILQSLVFNKPIISTMSSGDTIEILEQGKYGELVEIGDYNKIGNLLLIFSAKSSKKFNKNINRAKLFSSLSSFESYEKIFKSIM